MPVLVSSQAFSVGPVVAVTELSRRRWYCRWDDFHPARHTGSSAKALHTHCRRDDFCAVLNN